jgi:hypothetical protein
MPGSVAGPVLELVEDTFDKRCGSCRPERRTRRSAGAGALVPAVADLAGRRRDDRAIPRVSAVRPGRADLVGSRGFRLAAGRNRSQPRHAELDQQRSQCSSATGLARRQGSNKEQTAPVEQHLRPGRRAAPGPADSLIVGFAGRAAQDLLTRGCPGVRRRALRGPRGGCPCRCTRAMMESSPSRPVDLARPERP